MVYLFFFWISITHSYFNLIHFHTCNSLRLMLRMLCAAKTWLSILHCCSTAWKLNHGAGREEWGEVCISNPSLRLKAELWYSWHCSTHVFRYAVCWVMFPCISPERHWQVFNSCSLELGWQLSAIVLFQWSQALSGKVFSDSAACHRTWHNDHRVKAWGTRSQLGDVRSSFWAL